MALFSFGKDKKDQGSPELVLAYLEEAQRLRIPFQLKDPKGRELTANLQMVDEDGGRLTFQVSGALLAEKGDRVKLAFIQDPLRIGATAKLVEGKSGSAVLSLPTELELQERRKKPRARMNPREGATCTALTSPFEGVGVSGGVENISEEGVRLKVERAMEVKGERKLNIATGLFPVGHPFMIVKISKLPKLAATVEVQGKVVYLDSSGGGLSVGIAFTELNGPATSALRNVVSGRAGALPTTVPPKSRRPKEAPRREPSPASPSDPPRAAEGSNGSPPAAPSAPAPGPNPTAAPAPPRAAPEEPKAALDRNAALIRIKKRARIILLAMAPGGHRDLVAAHFQEEGYGKVLVAGTLTELLGLLREHTVALILIDGGVAELQGLDLAKALQQVGETHIPLVLAAEEVSATTVLAAREVGVDQLVVKPYALDEAFSGIFEPFLGLG